MNIIAIDDERAALNVLKRSITAVAPDCLLEGFVFADEALAYAKNVTIDVAFIDIHMCEMNGLVLAKHLKEIYRKTNIIFVTGYSEYALDAFAIPASGYLLKPVSPKDVKRELSLLRDPVAPHFDEFVRIKCFGSFGVFVNGKPLLFPHAKAKELLAYLVHKQGASANAPEIAALLWEDKEYNPSLKAQTRKVRSQLVSILRDAGIEDILCVARNSIAVDITKISCDYYDFFRGNVESINSYAGEYMNEYSWGEFTAAYLIEKTAGIF